MDPSIGDLKTGEILIDGDRIVAVGRELGAEFDRVIDAPDMIAMPGLVNAHLHTWQTGLRAIGCEWAHGDYFKFLHGGMAALYGPEDNYLGNLIGALNQIDGVIRKQGGRRVFPDSILDQRRIELVASIARIMREGDFSLQAA